MLSNQLIARLERLRIQSLRKVANRGRGEQLAGRGGSSIDFADYRDYTPGDDLRFVDWNIFSRLERPYLKLFRREEERHVVILIDVSRSMSFDGKLLRARELAAGFCVVALHAHDVVSVWAVDGAQAGASARRMAAAACAGRSAPSRASPRPPPSSRSSSPSRPCSRSTAAAASPSCSRTSSPKGICARASTCSPPQGLEPALIQILGASEVDPDLSGDVRLVDCESAGVLDVSAAGDLMALYHHYRLAYQKQLAEWCSVRQGRFLSISSADRAEVLLGEVLRRKGWLA